MEPLLIFVLKPSGSLLSSVIGKSNWRWFFKKYQQHYSLPRLSHISLFFPDFCIFEYELIFGRSHTGDNNTVCKWLFAHFISSASLITSSQFIKSIFPLIPSHLCFSDTKNELLFDHCTMKPFNCCYDSASEVSKLHLMIKIARTYYVVTTAGFLLVCYPLNLYE